MLLGIFHLPTDLSPALYQLTKWTRSTSLPLWLRGGNAVRRSETLGHLFPSPFPWGPLRLAVSLLKPMASVRGPGHIAHCLQVPGSILALLLL